MYRGSSVLPLTTPCWLLNWFSFNLRWWRDSFWEWSAGWSAMIPWASDPVPLCRQTNFSCQNSKLGPGRAPFSSRCILFNGARPDIRSKPRVWEHDGKTLDIPIFFWKRWCWEGSVKPPRLLLVVHHTKRTQMKITTDCGNTLHHV